MIRTLARYGTLPLYLLGFNGALVVLVGSGAPMWQPLAVLAAAMVCMLGLERLAPYAPDWNRSHDDAARDLAHVVVNTALSHAGVLLLPLLATLLDGGLWPRDWPFWLQVLGAVLVLDLGIAAAHHASHVWTPLWRFHAVHHSVKRMYGVNGLMKHPLHQLIETSSGIAPLLLLGIPPDVATALAFVVAIQLLLQHANVDYRAGPFKYLFATAEVHRFHHVAAAGGGDVNFGLFTTLWDHLAGTFHYREHAAPRSSAEIGIDGAPDYPRRYLAQLAAPFRR